MNLADTLGTTVDMEEKRYERRNRREKPEFEFGQEGDTMDNSDLFNSSNDSFDMFSDGNTGWGNSDPFGAPSDPFGAPSDPFGAPSDPFGASGMSGGFGGYSGGFGVGAQPQQPQQADTEIITWDHMVAVAKSAKDAGTKVVTFLKGTNAEYWTNTLYGVGKYGSIISAILAILTLLLFLLGKSVLGGLIFFCIILGLCLFAYFFLKDDYEKLKATASVDSFSADSDTLFAGNEFSFEDDTTTDTDPFAFEDDYTDENNTVEEDENADADDFNSQPVIWDDIPTPDVVENKPNTLDDSTLEQALSDVDNIPKGMYTRQFLFESLLKVLPGANPDFAKFTEIHDDEQVFYEMEDIIHESATVSGCKETVELQSMKENASQVIMELTRPATFKAEQFATEFTNLFRYKTNSSSAYAVADLPGSRCFLTLFKGEKLAITLKDMLVQSSKFMLDTENYLPVVVGIDKQSKVCCMDLKNTESMIVGGKPRGGKSWFVLSLLTQMAALHSPEELNFYFCDPKEDSSTFDSFRELPHTKGFATGSESIIKMLSNVVDKIAKKRKALLGEGHYKKVWDYNEDHPDNLIPIVYVVIDEAISVAINLNKEQSEVYRDLLLKLITQLPAFGIRAILIPHRLQNEIIPKNVSASVSCKVSVRGDAELIENNLGINRKEFPFALSQPGDMAVIMDGMLAEGREVGSAPTFIHSPLLAFKEKDLDKILNYLGSMWKKLMGYNENTSTEDASDDLGDSDLDIFDDVDDMEDAFSEGDEINISSLW